MIEASQGLEFRVQGLGDHGFGGEPNEDEDIIEANELANAL